MVCKKCGNDLDSTDKFCGKCGATVEDNHFFCGNCGEEISANTKFCPKCGKQNLTMNANIPTTTVEEPKKKKINKIIIVGALAFWLVIITTIIIGARSNGYFIGGEDKIKTEPDEPEALVKVPGETSVDGDNFTSFVYDNTYKGRAVTEMKEAKDLIVKDSVEQKDSCPKEIRALEEKIIRENDILAVNLCELDPSVAEEFANVLIKLWQDYPGVRGYLTNLGLFNPKSIEDTHVYAFFQSVFPFVEEGNDVVYKTHIELNSIFFLNLPKLDASLQSDIELGFHPKNAGKRTSTFVHEMGHYIEFVATLKQYNIDSLIIVNADSFSNFYSAATKWANNKLCLQILNSAYQKSGSTLSFDDWRATVSGYAVTKDNKGNYLYHETVAESVSDVFEYGSDASLASQYIVKELQGVLEGDITYE